MNERYLRSRVSLIVLSHNMLPNSVSLDVYKRQIQVYAGNFLDGSLTGKKGITYNQRASVCLETQKYPDTPNKPEWPSAVLRPGEKYMSQCIFKFSVNKN